MGILRLRDVLRIVLPACLVPPNVVGNRDSFHVICDFPKTVLAQKLAKTHARNSAFLES